MATTQHSGLSSSPAEAGPAAKPASPRKLAARRTPTPGVDADAPTPGIALLVSALAPALGLDPAAVMIEQDATDEHGAGALGPTTISLGASVRPSRSLVAHELTHVAQHRNRALPDSRPDVTAAEAEANALAGAAARSAPLWAPRATLPGGRVARLKDGTGVGASPAPVQTKPEHPTIDQLDQLVQSTRPDELTLIKGYLGDSSPSIDKALAVLDGLDFTIARSVARSLGSADLAKLARVADGDHKRHPVSAAAVLGALSVLTDPDLVALAGGTDGPLRKALRGIVAARLPPEAVDGIRLSLATVFGRRTSEQKPVIAGQQIIEKLEADRRDEFQALFGTVPSGENQDRLDAAYKVEYERTKPAQGTGAVTGDKPVPGGGGRIAQVAAAAQAAYNAPRGMDRASAALKALAVPELLAEPITAPSKSKPAAGTPANPPEANKSPSNAPPTPTPFATALATELDSRGLFDKLLDDLPKPGRWTLDYKAPLMRLLAGRKPGLTLPRIERKLSYGILNWWWVTDDDARTAYTLIRSLPLDVQDAWRLRDTGKWFERLEHNYPFGDRDAEAVYTGVGSEFRVGGVAAGADPKDVEKLFGELKPKLRSPSAQTAKQILRRLTGRNPDSGAEGAGKESAPVRTVVVRKLDAEGLLVKLYDTLPDDYLFGEGGRQEVLDLSSMRDPLNLERHATKLLTTGILHWWVSSRSAWLAYQLLRSLPGGMQTQWSSDHPDMWSAMLKAMTPEMRASLATSALTGRGAFPGREKIRERLKDPALWEPGSERQLRAVMDLARASDDADFVFEQSRLRRAFDKDHLKGLVRWFSLYDPNASPPRTAFKPEDIKPLGFGSELVRFTGLDTIVRFIYFGGELIWLHQIGLGYTIKLTNVDLQELQWAMGGDLGPAAVSRDAKSGASLPATPAREDGHQAANRVTLELDQGIGAFRLAVPELRLERVNIVKPGATYRTSTIVMKGLNIKAAFGDAGYKKYKPLGVDLGTERLDIDDLVLADSSVPAGAAAAGHVQTHPFHLRASATGTENLDKDLGANVPREGSVLPIWGIGPLLSTFANIVALKGGIPFSPTLIDLALYAPPLNVNLFTGGALAKAGNWAVNEGIELAADKAVPTPKPLDYLWGYATDGVFRPPRSVADRVQDAARMMRAFDVSFDELAIDGLTVGADTQLSNIVMKDVSLSLNTRGKLDQLRLLQTSLKTSLAKTQDDNEKAALQARLSQVDAELKTALEETGKDNFQKQRSRLLELEEKDRWHPGSLTKEESAELRRLSELIGHDTSFKAHIGSIEVGAISGKVAAGGASITGINLEGSVPVDLGGYYDDRSIAQRFVAGAATTKQTGQLAAGATLSLTIDSAKVTPTKDGPALVIAADTVPPSFDLMSRLSSLPADADPRLRQRLFDALEVVEKLEQVRTAAGFNPTPAQQDEIRTLTDKARAILGTSVGSIDLGRIEGGLDAAGRLTVAAKGFTVADIRTDTLAVTKVTGTVGFGLSGLPGLTGDISSIAKPAGLDQAKKALGLHLDLDVTAEGIGLERGKLDKATIAGLSGDLRMPDPGTYVLDNVAAKSLSVEGVNIGPDSSRIKAGKASVDGVRLAATVKTLKDGGYAVTVPQLHIDKISGNELDYHLDAGTESSDVHITSGALGQIDATDVAVTLPKDGPTSFKGGLTLGGIDDLRYSVVQRALNWQTFEQDEQLSVSGTVKGGSLEQPVPGAEGAPKPVLKVGFASDGTNHDYSLAIAGLKLLGTRFRSPDGHLTVTKTEISGSLRDVLDKEHPDKPQGATVDLTLTGTELRDVGFAAGTGYITNEGGKGGKSGVIKAESLHIVAGRETDAEGKPTRIKVDLVELLNLDADKLAYSDGPVQFHLGKDPDAQGEPGAAQVDRIRLTNFVIPYKADGTLGSLKSGRVAVKGAHLEFGGYITDSVESLKGRIDVGSLTVELTENSQKITLKGVSADAEVQAGTLMATAGLSGLGVTITHTKDAWLIDGLHLDEVHLDSLYVGDGWAVWTYGGKGAKITNVDAKARLELAPGGKPQRVVVDQFTIEKIESSGLTVYIPGTGSIEIPAAPSGPTAVINKIELVGPKEGADGTPFQYVFGDGGGPSGFLKINSTNISKLSSNIFGKFKGDLGLKTGAIKLGTVGDGKYTVDVSDPEAKLLADAELGAPDRRIFFRKLGAGKVNVTYNQVTKKWDATVSGAFLDGFTYRQPEVVVRLGHVKLPGDVTFNKGVGKIPELKIEDANIWLDLKALLAGPSTPAGTPPLVDKPTIYNLLDTLDGHIAMRLKVGGLLDRRLRLDVTTGRIDYAQVAALTGNALDFDLVGDSLRLNITVADVGILIGHWNLTPAETAEAKKSHTIRLRRLPDFNLDVPTFGLGGGSSSSSSGSVKPVFIEDIDVDISSKNDPITIPFVKGTVKGEARLAKDGLSHARATGTLMPVGGSGIVGLTLEGLSFDRVHLTIGTSATVDVNDGITIGKMDSGMLFFSGGTDPTALSAHITEAIARNITWTLP